MYCQQLMLSISDVQIQIQTPIRIQGFLHLIRIWIQKIQELENQNPDLDLVPGFSIKDYCSP